MNTKMKALSLALMAVSGLALAGTAAAACPAGPTAAEGGAWSGSQALGGVIAISTPGYKGTECRMDASITGGTGGSSAFVRDDTPSNEMRYRGQFTVDLDDLTSLRTRHAVRVFAANTEAPANGVPDILNITVYGNAAGTSKVIGFRTACDSPTGRCSAARSIGSTSGEITIEFDWQHGASGKLDFWVNNDTEASPTGSIAADNSAWGGVDAAYLGLAAASSAYRADYSGVVVGFDEFDSRRVSFIGN